MGDSAYKGVSATQDSRFTNKQLVLLRKLKFPALFETKVDMTKVELSVIKPWISRTITGLLGFEDDVVLEYAMGMLEEDRFPDPRKVQIQLMGFLEGKTGTFMEELWELLVSAQESVGGVPKRFVEEKKEELRLKREEGERVVREARERAQRAAEGTANERSENGRRRSRWDAGTPSASASNVAATDSRPPAYGTDRTRFPIKDEYRPNRSEWNRRRDDDYHRNGAHRSRDSGWSSRAPPPPAREEDAEAPRRSSRRSPSPAQHHQRRPPSPPPRYGSRSRSRSVTPDYRAELRDKKQHRSSPKKEDGLHQRDAKPSRRRDDQSHDRREFSRDRDRDRDDAAERRKRSRREQDGEAEGEGERELRDKLSRAKASRGSHRD